MGWGWGTGGCLRPRVRTVTTVRVERDGKQATRFSQLKEMRAAGGGVGREAGRAEKDQVW